MSYDSRHGIIYASEKYPEAPYGANVPEGGPGPNTLSMELDHMTEKMRNISDEDLYRVYHERWVNPDRAKVNSRTLKGDFIPFMSERLRRNKEATTSRHRKKTVKDTIEEYRRDHNALQRERLIHYMVDPEIELLDDEAILGSLFPEIEESKYPAFEMYKYKIKIEELHPYVYSIWDNVKHFYYREDQLKELTFQEIEPVGGISYSNPIEAYESLYDPVYQTLRSISVRNGELDHHSNIAHEVDEAFMQIYDSEDMNDGNVSDDQESDEFEIPPTNFFVKYAYAMLERSKENDSQRDIDYWSEIVRPFEYRPKEAPQDRPIFIEVPSVQLIRPGFGGEFHPNRVRTIRDPIGLPKLSSQITFDYIAYTPDNPDKVIDSTYRIGTPISFRWGMDELPKCLAMSMGIVTTGARLQVTCPPRLLFGMDGWPERGYPAGKEIVFDIEVRDVAAPTPMKASTVFYFDNDNPNSLY
jgi:hypothetical protein